MRGSLTVSGDDGADGPVDEIVLVHGTGGTALSHFGELLPHLPARLRIIGPDLSLQGLDPGKDDVIRGLGAQVLSALPDRRPRNRTLVGYSLGAVVAASLAASHPDIFTRLVLVAGWSATGAHQRLRQELQLRLVGRDDLALRQFTALLALGASFLSTKSTAEIESLVTSIEVGPDPVVQALVNRSVDISREAARIRIPTLIIAGTEDMMVPSERSRMLHATIPGAVLQEVSAGHALLHETPEQVASLILRFCAESQ